MGRILAICERRMQAEDPVPAAVYDRVAGTATDPEYEAIRRARTLAMIARRAEQIARRLIWC